MNKRGYAKRNPSKQSGESRASFGGQCLGFQRGRAKGAKPPVSFPFGLGVRGVQLLVKVFKKNPSLASRYIPQTIVLIF